MKPTPKKHIQWYYAAVLAALAIFAYDPGKPENSSGDTISARYWPVALIEHHTWSLTPFHDQLQDVGYAALATLDGKQLYPRNGWGMALFTVPFYAVVDVLNLGGSEWTPDRINAVSRWNAIAIAVASVIALFFLLSELVSPRTALVSSALFAFGTWNWSMFAQGLFSQTAAVLCHFINLHLIWRISKSAEKPRKLALAAALLHVVIWSLRPQDVVLVFPAALLMREKKVLPTYLFSFAGALFALMFAYSEAYGHFLGAYGVVEQMQGATTFRWQGYLGLLGLLFSPNRGALVFFPLLLAVPYLWGKLMPELGLRALWREKRTSSSASRGAVPQSFAQATALGAMIYLAMLSFVVYWHGTWSYGPRYLYDLLPYVWVPITLALAELEKAFLARRTLLPRWALALVALAAVESVAVHALGARNYDLYVWNRAVVPVDDEKSWMLSRLELVDVWNAGSNEQRYEISALERLRQFGF